MFMMVTLWPRIPISIWNHHTALKCWSSSLEQFNSDDILQVSYTCAYSYINLWRFYTTATKNISIFHLQSVLLLSSLHRTITIKTNTTTTNHHRSVAFGKFVYEFVYVVYKVYTHLWLHCASPYISIGSVVVVDVCVFVCVCVCECIRIEVHRVHWNDDAAYRPLLYYMAEQCCSVTFEAQDEHVR